MQEELDRVVGGDRCPGLADRARLPYTEAVLMEVQRHAHVLPLGVRHRSVGPNFNIDEHFFPFLRHPACTSTISTIYIDVKIG